MMSAPAFLLHQRCGRPRPLVLRAAPAMHLALPFQPEWTGGRPIAVALAELQAAGVTALELNVQPSLKVSDIELWHDIIKLALPNFILHLHAPLLPSSSGWPIVHALLQQITTAQNEPPYLIVHAPPTTAVEGNGSSFPRWLATLLQTLPTSTQVALELGWNWGAGMGLSAGWQRWRQQAAQRARSGGRPHGVGSGLGTIVPPADPRTSMHPEPVDPNLDWGRWWRRAAGTSAAGTRAATLALVDAVSDPRLWIAWDLAHDWLGGSWSSQAAWTTVPEPAFLQRVGYVRLHDVDNDGTDHLPLVVGNVPYTTQLRSLLRTPFDGPVCLAIRYTRRAAQLGSRAALQARSLAVARHVLKMS